MNLTRYLLLFFVGAVFMAPPAMSAADIEILNVSYDSTRELYADINRKFISFWDDQADQKVLIRQSHGGSVRQVNEVISGIDADVVTLGSASDVDALVNNGSLVTADWRSQFPNAAVPYVSTAVMLVRKGNPKNIKDWGDLARPGVVVVTPDPRTSGGGRWNFLSLYAFAMDANRNDPEKALAFVTSVYKNAPELDFSARSSVSSFKYRQHGDVLITWENEALATISSSSDKYELVVPSISMLSQPSIAVVTRNAKKHGTEKVAEAYLQYLYTPDAQEIMAKHFFRPTEPKVAAEYADKFAKIKTVSIGDFGGWSKMEPEFFWGGSFEKIYRDR